MRHPRAADGAESGIEQPPESGGRLGGILAALVAAGLIFLLLAWLL